MELHKLIIFCIILLQSVVSICMEEEPVFTLFKNIQKQKKQIIKFYTLIKTPSELKEFFHLPEKRFTLSAQSFEVIRIKCDDRLEIKKNKLSQFSLQKQQLLNCSTLLPITHDNVIVPKKPQLKTNTINPQKHSGKTRTQLYQNLCRRLCKKLNIRETILLKNYLDSIICNIRNSNETYLLQDFYFDKDSNLLAGPLNTAWFYIYSHSKRRFTFNKISYASVINKDLTLFVDPSFLNYNRNSSSHKQMNSDN